MAAWKMASERNGYTLICESDFVPCVGIGSFPIFWPLQDELAYGYLYQGSPRLLAVIGIKFFASAHYASRCIYYKS